MTDLTKLYPIVHHPAWAGWTGAAHRRIDGGVPGDCEPVFGLAFDDGGAPRPLTSGEIMALGDPAALEARAIANLDAVPYTFELVETTKGFLGMGKKPLAFAVRGRLAPERVMSPAFLAAARARLGGASNVTIGLPDRETIYVRNYDAPHSHTAFDFATRVRGEAAAPGKTTVCNGLLISEGSGLVHSTYVRPPEPSSTYPFPARELRAPRRSKDGSEPVTPPAELEPVPELAPPPGLPLRLLGRHRTLHHLEVELSATTSAELGDPGRAALARMASAFPGTLVRPITWIRVLVPANANLGDLEWSLRHPLVSLYEPGKKAGVVQCYRGPSARAATNNLRLSLAEVAALG